MNPPFYTNPGEECFGVSLANFFVLIGDKTNETRVRAYYRMHAQVKSSERTPMGLTPMLVRSLSQDEYDGILFAEDYWFNLAKSTDIWECRNERDFVIADTIQGEIANGRIRPINRKLRFSSPTIAFIKYGKDGHAVVDLHDRNYLDDGVIVKKDRRPVIGRLELIKLKSN